MLTPKFNYQKLSRKNIDGKRFYISPTGDKLPSVTTILGEMRSDEKRKKLNDWRNRVGKVNAANITIENSSRGTRVHSFLENYIKVDDIGDPGTNPYSIQSHKMAQVIISNGLNKVKEFYGSECSLFFPKLWAGSTDCVALYNNDLAIIDFKQTSKPKKKEWITDYFEQLGAYIISHDEVFHTDIKYGIIMMCSPDLVYQEWIITGEELDFYKSKWWDKLEKYYMKKFGVFYE